MTLPTNRAVLPRAATWAFLLVSLLAGIVFVALRVGLPSDGARAGFYAGAWGPDGVRIDPIDAPAAGLEPGDEIRSIDGVALDAWVRAALDPTVPRPDAAGSLPYDVVRGGAPVRADISWAAGPPLATLAGAWGVVLFSLVIAGVAAFVFHRRPHEPAARALVVVAAAAAGSSVPWFLGVTTSDVVRGLSFALHALITGPLYMLLWPGAIHLALAIPTTGATPAHPRRVVPGVYVAALGAYGLLTAASALASPTALSFVGTWPVTQVAVVLPCLVVATALLVRAAVRAPDPTARARAGLIAAAATVSASLGIVLFWLPVLLTGRSLAPDGALGLIALPVPLSIAVAILRDRLFDIDAALNRTLVYGTLTAGVLAVYVSVAAVAGAALGTSGGFGTSLLATGAAALAALPLRDALQRAVSRLLYGRRREPLVAMRQLGRQLAWAGDPEAAVPAIAATVREVLRVPYAGVEMERGGDAGVLAAESGIRPPDPIVVPLLHGAAPVGRLLLGRRSGERDFHPDERQLLDDLARQAGIAVAALALQDALARSAERTVLAREEERRRLRRDLHDGLGPALAAIGMRAEAAAVQLPPGAESAQASLEALGEDVSAAIADVRRLVEGLRPPALDELGLVAAIRQQAGRLAGDPGGGTGPRIHVDGPPPGSMPELAAAVEVAAYRITVEALTNVVRHARASTCEVRLRHAAGSLEVEVCDDGIGLPDVPRSGVGLESMRVRAAEVGGDLIVERRRPAGTRVLARMPVGPAPMVAS